MSPAPQKDCERRLVIVTSDGPEHRYVVNRIATRHVIYAVIICDRAPRRPWYKVLRHSPKRFLDKALWRLFLKIIGDVKMRQLALKQVLGSEINAFTVGNIHNVGRPNAGKLAQKIKELSPDILAIYGTSIIPDSVLKLSNNITLNMHTGISPYYRGTACSFWPIHNREPNLVGATIHECTSDIDGGKIFASKKAKLYRDDRSLHHVFARSVLAGVEIYNDVLDEAISGTLSGETQCISDGREYRGSERGLRSELTARWHLRCLRRKWPRRLDVD